MVLVKINNFCLFVCNKARLGSIIIKTLCCCRYSFR